MNIKKVEVVKESKGFIFEADLKNEKDEVIGKIYIQHEAIGIATREKPEFEIHLLGKKKIFSITNFLLQLE